MSGKPTVSRVWSALLRDHLKKFWVIAAIKTTRGRDLLADICAPIWLIPIWREAITTTSSVFSGISRHKFGFYSVQLIIIASSCRRRWSLRRQQKSKSARTRIFCHLSSSPRILSTNGYVIEDSPCHEYFFSFGLVLQRGGRRLSIHTTQKRITGGRKHLYAIVYKTPHTLLTLASDNWMPSFSMWKLRISVKKTKLSNFGHPWVP